MTKRHKIIRFGILCFAAFACELAAAETSALSVEVQNTGKQPNILWIVAEDINPNIGCYGDAYAVTPVLDKLATEGIRFTQCFAEPACAPSRFMLITSMHNGPFGTSQMRSRHPVPSHVKGFPSYLRAAGYYCTNNSKTDYNCADEPRLIRESWDESSAKAHWRNRKSGQPFFAVFNYIDTHQAKLSVDPYELFQKRVQSRLKPEQIHDPAKAALPPYFPDTPVARRTYARYHDCISSFDDFVGKMLGELEADGLAGETVVMVYADNGAGILRGKSTALETGLRVPLLVRFPVKFRHLATSDPGKVSDRLVSFPDFGPTVLHLAGVAVPSHMDGRPFLGRDIPAAPAFVIGTKDRQDEVVETTRWLNDGRFHYIRSYINHVPFDQHTVSSFYNGGGLGGLYLRGGAELCREVRALKAAGKLTDIQTQFWGDSRPAEALYDSKNDPWNLKNLAEQPEYQEQLLTMRRQLREWIVKHRDLAFWPEPEMAEAAKRGIPSELAKQDDVYPLERVLATAELVGAGPGVMEELRLRLKDDDASVRYWAAVGLHALREGGRSALGDLKSAMGDSAVSVRLEAAWAVADLLDDPVEATAVLAAELESPNDWAAHRAARALEQLRGKARPHLSTIQKALSQARSRPGYGTHLRHSYEFALQGSVEFLDMEKTQ